MKIHRLVHDVPPALAHALREFESPFLYPLGPARRFRIDHGEDYPRFFRSMGAAMCLVAERDGVVLGVLSCVVRPLLLPDGRERRVAYLGDLKIAPAARGGRVLIGLARAAERWLRPQTDAAFAVIMDGTSAVPASYTGRAGIPAFRRIGAIAILRLPSGGPIDERWTSSRDRVERGVRELAAGRFVSLIGDVAQRSASGAVALVSPAGDACGLVEETELAKRLITEAGEPLRSAHLSGFAYRDPRAGAALLAVARAHAGRLGFPALFVAVAECDAPSFPAEAVAPATIFATGLDGSAPWCVNTSEI